MSVEDEINAIGVVILCAVAIGAFVRNRGWNPSLWLLGAGVIFGLLPYGPQAPPDPEFVLVLILAPLVFGEGLSSSIVDLRRVSRPVMALAVGLVVFGAFVVGFVTAAIVPGLPLAAALCLGAILGPTDAVAVSATAKSAGLPRRLIAILEGESLVNDGTALTLLRVFIAAAVAGSVTTGQVAVIFLTSVIGGVAAGLLGGWILILLVRRSRDTTIANGCILVAPFPIYLGAERLEGSGILAVVVAALLLAHATSSAVAYTGRLQATSVWRTITFILQSAAFFIVGLDVPDAVADLNDTERRGLFVLVPATLFTLILVRFAFVYVMTRTARSDRIRDRGWIVIAWAGARGPISGLAAFTLPLTVADGSAFPERSLIICVTFCVVVLSLCLAPTTGVLARWLDLTPDDDAPLLKSVRISLARASLDRLENIIATADRTGDPIDSDVVDGMRQVAERRLDVAGAGSSRERIGGATSLAAVHEVRLEMAHAEQAELIRLRREEGLPDSLMRELQNDLDVRMRAIRSGST